VLSDVEIDRQLQQLCTPPSSGPDFDGMTISTQCIRDISALLRLLDLRTERHSDYRYQHLPRTYSILRSINGLHLFEQFVKVNYTDIFLPYTDQTLPEFVERGGALDMRQKFLDIQDYYLTNTKEIKEIEEGSLKSNHLMLEGSGNAFFAPIRQLGQGGFG
jgi:hypothetical protein